MFPDDWAALAPLVDAVLDAPTDQRADALDAVSGGDLARRAAVERLVAECERDVPMLDRPAAERFARLLVEDDDLEIPETLGGRYRIVRELGRGGMACVYLARDTKHARDVAVKVIRPDVAASLGRDRFLREIGIAARLRHPNIVPLYDSGAAAGLLYFVMPFEVGPSLRERLSRPENLPVAERVSVLRDVARALAYAHEQGVVHRDVKPDNVMLSGGAAVVTDFGIAKAVSAAQGDAPAGTITQAGAGIGTAAYMAPEQAVGDPSTDHRADIYSFGCLAYELFAGHPPFHDLPTHQIIGAHVGTAPVPLPEVSAAVPASVARLVARCLEKNPAARPQSAYELLAELEGSQTGPNEAVPPHRWPPRSVLVASAFVGVVLISGAAYFVSRGRTSSAAKAPREVTVAVLPLVSTGDSVQRDLAYGLSDEIATALVNVPGVRVMSRRSVAGSREQRDVDPAKTGREWGAEFLVMGSLKAVSGRLTVLAKLVQARDGATLWAKQFDRNLDQLADVRNEIVAPIGDSLRLRAGAPIDARARPRPARILHPEAYRLYVLAQRALTLRGQSIRSSIENFRRATELDTLYADAFSGLSLALALAPYFQNTPPQEVAGEVRSAAQRALHLDPTLARPHVALGLVHQHGYALDSAAAEFQTAVRLRSPDDIEPLVQYGRHLFHRGRAADAVKQFILARRTEPASAVVSSLLSYVYYLQGDMDSALVESARAFQSDSANITTLSLGTVVRLAAHDSAGARDFAIRLHTPQPTGLYVLAAIGDTTEAFRRLRAMEAQRPNRWMVRTARAFTMLGVGDTTEALAALERATDANELWPTISAVIDPIFDPIRSSTRFHDLLRRVDIPVSDVTIARPSVR
jgi:TolB-like protein/tRNA A-37 threonylcarbamoyl transferase component Bud32/Tfp pilus assembly protein PilF